MKTVVKRDVLHFGGETEKVLWKPLSNPTWNLRFYVDIFFRKTPPPIPDIIEFLRSHITFQKYYFDSNAIQVSNITCQSIEGVQEFVQTKRHCYTCANNCATRERKKKCRAKINLEKKPRNSSWFALVFKRDTFNCCRLLLQFSAVRWLHRHPGEQTPGPVTGEEPTGNAEAPDPGERRYRLTLPDSLPVPRNRPLDPLKFAWQLFHLIAIPRRRASSCVREAVRYRPSSLAFGNLPTVTNSFRICYV